VEDLELIELIEREISKLTDHGREIWDLIETAVEANAPGSPEFIGTLPDLSQRWESLAQADSFTIKRLIKLTKAHQVANALESECTDKQFASERRQRGVIEAAQWKDKEVGRPINLDMTVLEAFNILGYT
jgi:hypothetical protein